MKYSFAILLLFSIATLMVLRSFKKHKSSSLFDELDCNNLKKGTVILSIEDDSVRRNRYSHTLAYEISKENVYQSQYIGLGKKSDQYEKYKWLLDSATETTLVQLFQHKNLVLKAYVFQILIERHYEGLKHLFELEIDNTNTFHTQSGCFGGYINFNYFSFKCMEDQLSGPERVKYKAILSKYYDAETWKEMEFFNL